MRFSPNKYYIASYVKCDNCGMLMYDNGITGKGELQDKAFCSDWCNEWATAKSKGVVEPKIALPPRGAI